ncbi:hypothetical protein NQ314_010024 [Rhamnusium bicolor]|uniref:DDE-1 domain-containing protein n=1 Tax=Rhamnusium bicolor TaxID=1586634 RepID=A0AAV8XU61_9CUCU|nr:hypothetical protein NQ314_010024 [Rhamnusium bicolor]
MSVMMAGSANRILLPPHIVYRAENLYPTWAEYRPIGSRYNRGKSGWFDGTIFEDWYSNIVLPYLKKQPATRALIGDNLFSNISYNVMKSCRKNDINFILLPPNATHLCQPLDVAFFCAIKGKMERSFIQVEIEKLGRNS